MHKRTLYITDESYQKVLDLSTKLNTSHADILRRAVEIGLNNLKIDAPSKTSTPHPSSNPIIIPAQQTEQEQHATDNSKDSLLLIFARTLQKIWK
ncbi:hypothetical protein HYW54_00125 [Candidatus Gottesmanbacteria bacterium]|nr:hypothetical protein [Candidatus Gottesmanbacteria bacterium]